jgi:proteasome assembly chaperone (PAC2) family protein
MNLTGIHFSPPFAEQRQQLTSLDGAILIAGFDGWGNALGMSQAFLDHLMSLFPSRIIARLDGDTYFSYDETRPQVEIKDGRIKTLTPPGGAFHLVTPDPGRPLILLKSHEPHLNWDQFANALVAFAMKLNISTVITLGSLYDNVLHTERVISALVSSDNLRHGIQSAGINLSNYSGPSAIHSTIHMAAQNHGFDTVSFWCHCPHYLQGSVHFGLLARLGKTLARWFKFEFDTAGLEKNSQELDHQVENLIETNPKLGEIIAELKRNRLSDPGNTTAPPPSESSRLDKETKVIDITKFLDP